MPSLDISDLVSFNDDAIQRVRDDLRQMHPIVEAKAKLERSDHAYKNRTHQLEQSTFATIPTFNGDVLIEFGARTHYASYVGKYGRGLMRIHERTAQAMLEIGWRFYTTLDSLARKSNG